MGCGGVEVYRSRGGVEVCGGDRGVEVVGCSGV